MEYNIQEQHKDTNNLGVNNGFLNKKSDTWHVDFNVHKNFTEIAQSKRLTCLPNGILSKSYTGLGITYYFVNKMPQPLKILVVPTQKLVREKAQICDVFIMQGVSISEVKDSILNALYNKEACSIATTYEGLSKLLPILEQLDKEGVLSAKHWHVLFDEYHALVLDRTFKACYEVEVIQNIQKLHDLGTHCTYTSATVLNDTEAIGSLKNLPVTHVQASQNINQPLVTVCVPKPVKRSVQTLVETIIHYIKNSRKKSLNPYVFLNNVTKCIEIAKTLNLAPDKVNFICSKDQISRLEREGFKWSEGEVNEGNVKPFNFVTCSAFEGVDFNDNKGVAIIVSPYIYQTEEEAISPKKLVQILGRIKDPQRPFSKTLTNTPILIYNDTPATPYDYVHTAKQNKQNLEQSTPLNLEQLLNKKSTYNGTKRSKEDYVQQFSILRETLNFYHDLPKTGVTSKEVRYTINNEVLQTGYFFEFKPTDWSKLSIESYEIVKVLKLEFLEAQARYNELENEPFKTMEQRQEIAEILKNYPLLAKVRGQVFETYNEIQACLKSQKSKLLEQLQGIRRRNDKGVQFRPYTRGQTIPVQQIKNDIQGICKKLNLVFDVEPLVLFKSLFEVKGLHHRTGTVEYTILRTILINEE